MGDKCKDGMVGCCDNHVFNPFNRGFSIHNENILFYRNSITEAVVVVFMILGSINFSLYYQIVRGKLYRLYEPEFSPLLNCFVDYMLRRFLSFSWGILSPIWRESLRGCMIGQPHFALRFFKSYPLSQAPASLLQIMIPGPILCRF